MPDASRNTEDHNPVKDRRAASFVSDWPARECRRCKWLPQSSPGAAMFFDVLAEIFSKIFQRTLKGFDCARRKGAECVSRSKKFRLKHKNVKIPGASSALFHCEQNPLRPRQPAPTRGAPATRFLRKEVFKIPDHTDRTRLVVQHNHGSRTQPTSRSLHVPIVHWGVQMLLYKEVSRRSARQQPAKTEAVAHSSRMIFDEFTHRRAHRKLPESRPLDFAANAKQLRTPVLGQAQTTEPIRPLVHNVVNIAKRLHILDDRWFSPEPANLGEWRLRSWMCSLSLECIQQGSLFAADVTASACV